MNKELKDKWVAALRSGKYQQTTGLLQRTIDTNDKTAGFCCLGVLCEVAGFEYSPGVSACLDNETAVQLGLSMMAPNGDNSYEGILMEMNDTERKTFAEIADYIDENL